MKHRYLFGLLLGLVFSCLYLFHVTYSDVKEKAIADFNSRQLIHARQAGRGIEEYFKDLIIFLTKLSESEHVIVLDGQGRKEMALALKTSRQEMKAITRVDAKGRILYTLPYDASAIGRDISYQKHIREIMNTRKPVVSDVFTAVQGYNAIALHVPVFKGKEYRGTLCFLIDFEAISRRFLQDIRIGDTGYAWVTSRDGIELYCPVPGHTGKSVFENCKEFPSIISMAKEMVKGRQGATTYTYDRIRDRKTETVSKYAVYLPVEIGNTFWSIVVASSADEVLASLESFRNKLIFVVGLLLLGGAVFSFYGMRARVIIREEAKRQKIEEALRESEEHYRSLFENNHAAMLIIDPDNAAIVDANAAACSCYGWSREDFKKLRIDEINTLTNEEIFAEMQSAKSEKRDHFFFKHRRADGTIRDVEVYSGPLAFKGKVLLYSIIHDITERKRAEEALRESEERYRDLVESATDLICTHDLKGTLLSVNAAAVRAAGFAAEELVGLCISDTLPQNRRHEFYGYIRDIQRNGTAAGTMKIMTRKGEARFWEYRNTLRTEGVTEPLVRGMARDVTGEVLARRALKKSEKRYRLLFERNLAGVYRTTIDGRLLDCNEAFNKIYGYDSRDEAMRHTVADFHVSPEARQEFIDALQAGKMLIDFESRGRRKDGSLIWLLENAALVPDEEGELTEIEGTLIDITTRKRTEEALRESEEKYRMTFDTSPDSVNINRLEDGLYADINDGFTQLTGFTRKEVIGRTSLEINIWDNPADRQKLVQGLREKGYYENLEARFRRKDGSIGIGLMSARVISMNSIPHIISITRDITERKRMEDELLKADKLESVGILAGGIAHDFNNILTSIAGNISMAKMHLKPGSRVFDLLSSAEKASMRASGLTGQLLAFAKGGTPVKEIVSISRLIEESSLSVLQGLKSGCEFSLAEDLWTVEADAGQISQVISNIVINANQAMPEGGIIQVITENMVLEEGQGLPVKPGRYIRISIKDQGVGIADKHLSKIFDPYFTTKKDGSGLGLAAVYSIIKKHNGCIVVDSRPGAGTTIDIYLPASDKAVPVEEETALLTGQGKILLMDDDSLLRVMAGEMMEILGYEADFAADGMEAINMFREARKDGKPYDAVILDLTIPGGIGGKEAIKKMLELDQQLKAIVCSGYSDDPVMANYREYGFKGVMPKPFDLHALGRVLNDVLKGTRHEA